MSKLSSRLFVCMFLGLCAPAASAQEAAHHACSSISDAGERLACYDQVFPPVAGARGWGDPEVGERRSVEEFGLSKRQLLNRSGEVGSDRISGVVKTVTARGGGELLVTLENGHVWLLTGATGRLIRLVPGDAVVIREAALGSYMLITPAQAALRAKRLH